MLILELQGMLSLTGSMQFLDSGGDGKAAKISTPT